MSRDGMGCSAWVRDRSAWRSSTIPKQGGEGAYGHWLSSPGSNKLNHSTRDSSYQGVAGVPPCVHCAVLRTDFSTTERRRGMSDRVHSRRQ